MSNILSLPQIPAIDTFSVDPGSYFGEGIQFLSDVTTVPVTPVPLDGISFSITLYASQDAVRPLTRLNTDAGTLTVAASIGVVYFAILPRYYRDYVGTGYGDLVARADGLVVNLCRDYGPLQFNFLQRLRE